MSENNEKCVQKCRISHGGSSEALYGLGVIGAAVYYLQNATSFTSGAVGLIKAIGWPAVLLYRVFELLRM